MNDVDNHIDMSLAKVRVVFNKTKERIDRMRKGEKIPATELAKQVAAEMNTTGPILYPIMKYVLNDSYPGIKITRGCNGGVEKL